MGAGFIHNKTKAAQRREISIFASIHSHGEIWVYHFTLDVGTVTTMDKQKDFSAIHVTGRF